MYRTEQSDWMSFKWEELLNRDSHISCQHVKQMVGDNGLDFWLFLATVLLSWGLNLCSSAMLTFGIWRTCLQTAPHCWCLRGLLRNLSVKPSTSWLTFDKECAVCSPGARGVLICQYDRWPLPLMSADALYERLVSLFYCLISTSLLKHRLLSFTSP